MNHDLFNQPVFDVGSTDSRLIVGARENSSDAWEQIVTVYGPLVYTWLRRLGASPEDCRDLVQDVLTALACNIKKFDRDRSDASFRGWLWVITRNKLRDLRRRQVGLLAARGGTSQVRLLHAVAADMPSSSDESAGPSDDACGLGRALGAIQGDFSDRTWQAFWLTAVEELDSKEVAQTLEMSRTAVRLAKLRVLRRLREEVQRYQA